MTGFTCSIFVLALNFVVALNLHQPVRGVREKVG